MKTVALFGGSFNPPHVGHALAALYLLATAPIDELWVIPCYRHPFEKPLAPYEDRFEMCRRTMEPLGGRALISRVEAELGGESRTVVTLRHLHARFPGTAFRWVIGSDLLGERERWLGWPEIARLAPPLIVGREGHPVPDLPGLPLIPGISSSEVRAKLRSGEDVSLLVPRAVTEYIRERSLYQDRGASA